jgi:hypothetical protein
MSMIVDFHFAVQSDHATHGGVGTSHGEQISEMIVTPNILKESTTTNKLRHVDRSQPCLGSLTKPTIQIGFSRSQKVVSISLITLLILFSQLSPIATIFVFKDYNTFRVRMYHR